MLDQATTPDTAAAARARRPLGFAFWVAVGWLGGIVALAVLAGLLPIPDPNAIAGDPGAAPGPHHLLGTDEIGRDELSRVIYGARISLIVGSCVAAVGFLLGGPLGLIAGYFRGRLDAVVSLLLDSMLSFPYLIFALAAVAFIGQGLPVIVGSMGAFAVAPTARVVRGATLQWSNREFVLAARVLGASTRRIISREVLPNVAPVLLSYGLIAAAFAIIIEAVLAFLGVSVRPPDPTWGNMVAASSSVLVEFPILVVWPSAALLATVLALNFAGDRLQRHFEVQEGRL
jgi:peptide/nickel transport system permease protein